MKKRISKYLASNEFFEMTQELVHKAFQEYQLHQLEKEFNLHIYVNQEYITTYKTNLSLEQFLKKMKDKSDFIQLDYLVMARHATLYNKNKVIIYSNEVKTISLRKNIIASYQIIN